jgi:hypothetical protein
VFLERHGDTESDPLKNGNEGEREKGEVIKRIQ